MIVVDGFLTPLEVSKELQVARSTVYKWLRADRIKHTRVGSLYRITIEQLENFKNGEK